MSETSLGKFNQAPKMRVQKAEVSRISWADCWIRLNRFAEHQNATKALDFIRSRGIRLTNIGEHVRASAQ